MAVNINIVADFSLLEVVTSVFDRRLAGLILISSLILVSYLISNGLRTRHDSIHDPLVIMPPGGNVHSVDATRGLGRGERWMTSQEIELFRTWNQNRNRAFWVFAGFAIAAEIADVSNTLLTGNVSFSLFTLGLLCTASGGMLATGNAFAHTAISLRTGLPAFVSVVCFSAAFGASDGMTLITGGENTSFPRVLAIFDGQSVTGTLVAHDAVNTLIMDDLRRFSLLSSPKISEIRYLPQ